MVELTADRLGAPASGISGSKVGRFATTDPDTCADHLRSLGIDARHNQMSRGHYSVAIDSTLLPGLRVLSTVNEPAITSHAASPDSRYTLVLPISSTEGVFFNHAPLAAEIGLVRPGSEFHIVRPSGFRAVMVFPEAALVDRLCDAMFGHTFARMVEADRSLQCEPDALAACAQRLSKVHDDLPPGLATAGAERLAYELVDALLGILRPTDRALGWSASTRIARAAWDVIEGCADEGVTVADLCVRLGVPLRTLDNAFHACLGIAPKRFINTVRLNKVRRCLSRPRDEDTVTRVAAQFGFFHFGHFAYQYRRLFGESPSQTLSRAKR
jgi:AraC family ethanolamine operon transcriptional activator